ncbi:methylenetetrahydrofolate reductase [Rhodospirillaceae bacterium SYSU D60014]|uniref:methylenetetrahydrofolate reductase n=1 Tax=Virgifigura deserti TaxID=2268457 RepID=UPI000E66A04C
MTRHALTADRTATRARGRLEAVLRRGDFALTAETSPPDAGAPAPVLARGGCLKGLADAVNVTDGAGARAHMSALAAAALLARDGIEPVLQFTMRDRNRLALQGDILGAAALGIPNILCLHGDDVATGDQPEAKPVYDIDSRELMRTARRMRDEGTFPSGRPIEPRPALFIGAADRPTDPKPGWKPDALLAKIDAGADFVQTQYCFDMDLLRRYLARLADHGVLERLFVIVGIGPIASAKSARWMNENLFGVQIPEEIVRRLDGARDQQAEGRRICVELLQELSEIDGVGGAHLMAPRQEEAIAEVIADSGLLSRRSAA